MAVTPPEPRDGLTRCPDARCRRPDRVGHHPGRGSWRGGSSRIENYPGFPDGISGGQLADGAHRQALRFGAEVLVGVDLVHGRPQPDGTLEVELTSDSTFRARTAVAATGVRYRRLDAPGLEELVGRGVYYGAAPGEGPAYRDSHVVIVGGANSAGQAALHFADYATKVTVLVRADSLAAGMSRYLVERVEAHERIDVQTKTTLVGAYGEQRLETIRAVGPRGEEAMAADALFVLIGGEPLTAGVEEWLRVYQRGYFLTGPDLLSAGNSTWSLDRDPLFLESSQPGIFVAGDVRHGSIKRVASAVGEGAMAIALIQRYLTMLTNTGSGSGP